MAPRSNVTVDEPVNVITGAVLSVTVTVLLIVPLAPCGLVASYVIVYVPATSISRSLDITTGISPVTVVAPGS